MRRLFLCNTYVCLLVEVNTKLDLFSHLSPMCSGGVRVAIIGVDVDAAVDPILTLFNRNNSTGSGVSGTFLNTELHIELVILHNCTICQFSMSEWHFLI